MSIQPTVSTAASRYQANSNPVEDTAKKTSASELSEANKRQLNQTILDNQLSLSLQSDDKAMNLLYRAISDAVEKRLAAQSPAGQNRIAALRQQQRPA